MAESCPAAPRPIIALTYESRYADSSDDRSEIDPKAAQEVEEALAPMEDFIRQLSGDTTEAARDEDAEAAACVLLQIAEWARADALSKLKGSIVMMTVGSRLAAFALIQRQSHGILITSGAELSQQTQNDLADTGAWLDRRIIEQITFWELDAPAGAASGNLRAWASLAAAARAADPAGAEALRFRVWSAASTVFVLCTAEADGSLPQEMRRGKRALQYQLHALAPLTVTTLLLQEQGIPLATVCDSALHRAVGFALTDIFHGEATERITGQVQTFFDGSQTIEGFHVAWIAAYLHLDDPTHFDLATETAAYFGSLSYSKLGGDQTVMWENCCED